MLDTIRTSARTVSRRLLEMVCPVGCLGCNRPLDDVSADLCPECWQQLSTQAATPYCDMCGFGVGPYHVPGARCPSCKSHSFRFDEMARVGAHRDLLRTLIVGFKFQKRPDALGVLGSLLAAAVSGRRQWDSIDAFVPIPAHYKRRIRYGQPAADHLARFVGRALDCPVAGALRVARPGPPQRGLSATKRWANVRGRFGLSRAADVAGACLCLIDDVSTTGATLHEAAKVLKAAGARRVFAAVATKRDPVIAAAQE